LFVQSKQKFGVCLRDCSVIAALSIQRPARRFVAVSFTAYEFGTKREPLQHLLDAQVAKSFELRGGSQSLSVTVSAFNILNANTVRGSNTNLNSLSFGQINEILAPRVARIQVSFRF
jgi:hypothetical protein